MKYDTSSVLIPCLANHKDYIQSCYDFEEDWGGREGGEKESKMRGQGEFGGAGKG